ncbi:MAG: HDOD domain-containing protein [bacterium]|nr:HDOD domain-containing protein [bacterium]
MVKMEKNGLQAKIYSKIEELPTLPVVISTIIRLTEDPKSSTADITEAISRDPAMTSKILKVANSAYYGFSQKIADLERGVALLGFNMVKSLAVSIGVMGSVPRGNKSDYFSGEGLWQHSSAVATVLRELGKKYGKKDSDDYFFVVGLLHDIGKLVMDQFFHEQFLEVMEEANDIEKIKLHITEKRVIGIDHCEVSAMLLRRWNFPDKIIEPIEFHHKKEEYKGKNILDIALLRIANSLAQEFDWGKDGNAVPNTVHDADLEIAGMTQDDLADMKVFIKKSREEIYSLFSSFS